MPTDIAELGIKIEATDIKDAVKELSRLEKQSGKTESSTKNLTASIKGATASAVKWGAVAGGAAAAGTVAFYKSQLNLYDQLGKLSTRLGASTEALSEYRHVAELSGVSFETLTMGWQRMTRRIAEAAQGTGEAKGALIELGLSAESLAQLAPEQQFEAIAQRLSQVKAESDRVRLAMKLFDSEGVSLIQTMKGGADGLREMREEARKLGLTVSTEAAVAAEEFNDNLTRMQSAATGAGRAILEDMMPSLTRIGEAMADTAKESGVLEAIWIGLGGAMAEAFGLEGSAAWEAEQQTLNLNVAIRDTKTAIGDSEDAIVRYQGLIQNAIASGAPAETIERLNGLIDQQRERVVSLNSELMRLQGTAEAGGDTGGDEGGEDGGAAAAFDLELEALMEGFNEEAELLQKREERRREHVLALKEMQKQETADAKNELDRQQGVFASALAAGAQNNKALFEAQKAYRISKIAMETPAAIADSYAWGASWGGPPGGALMAGIAGAAMLSYAASIASSSYGGGGGGGGGASAGSAGGVGFTPSAPSEPLAGAQPAEEAAPVREVRVTVEGDGPNSEGMRRFAENLAETLRDMGSDTNLVIS